MSTLKHIASATGLGVATVSEILRDKPGYQAETRRLVRAAAKRLGYRPNLVARQLRGQPSGLIGAIIGAGDPRANFERLAHLEAAAFAQGFRLLVGQIHGGSDAAARYVEDFQGRGVDGMIWLHQPYRREAPVPETFFAGAPNVIFLDESTGDGGGCVKVDYADGILQAVRHLATTGRRRIGLALDGPGWPGNPMSERLRGYRAGLRVLGRRLDRRLVWVGDSGQMPTAVHVADIVSRLCEIQGADAVLASNDVWACALIRALRRNGRRVPEDVAVVGFDNLDLAALFDPSITTIDQNHGEFARIVVDMLKQMTNGPLPPSGRRLAVVRPRLVIRESA